MKVVHCKREKYSHYIGRPSIFGNPFSHKKGTLAKYKVETVEEAVKCYEYYARRNSQVLKAIAALPEEAKLGCWCKIKGNEPCHGDAIKKIWKDMNG